jgi:hypothetical protein
MTFDRMLLGAGTLALFAGALGCDASSPKATSDDSSNVPGSGAVPAGSDALADFSFFVTSLRGLQELSGNESGFGGDLRFGETGAGAGLRGADKICAALAERSMPGSSQKGWRAFLSAVHGGDGDGAVNAIDRVGQGPWYDRLGRLVAETRGDLASVRPVGADQAISNDLPNEDGVPNHQPDPSQGQLDNHDTLTGSTEVGTLYSTDPGATCNDWTSAVGVDGRPRVGHSWPRTGGFGRPGGRPFPDGGVPPFFDGGVPPPGFFGGPPPGGFPPTDTDGGLPPGVRGRPRGGGTLGNMSSWISALDEAGCAPGVNLIEMGAPDPSNPTVGSGGGYGGFYCFALAR